MKTVNAKGKTCPEPVAMTEAEVARGETELEVLLDNPVSAFNVMRFLESNGFFVQLKDDDGAITISARKGEHPPKGVSFKKQPDARIQEAQACLIPKTTTPCSIPSPKPPPGAFSVFITNQIIGRCQGDQGDQKLGESLMKNFLGVLSQTDPPPIVVALVNDGVKLALYDSSSCDHLRNLEKKGVSILICGTCVNHFNIMDQMGAGSISHMFEIVEALSRADKVMTI